MPSIKRKRSSRRSGSRKRSRRSFNTSIPRSVKSNVLTVKRTFYAGNWAWSTATTAGFWRYEQYTLGGLPNAAEYTALFDEYKISAIKVQYRPSFDSVDQDASDAAIGQTNWKVNAHTLVDQASTVVATGTYTSTVLNTFLENGKVKTQDGNKPFSVYYKPNVYMAVTGGGTGSLNTPAKFMRTTDTAVNHTGHHVFLQTNGLSGSNTNIRYDIFVTYYLQFRGMR